MLKLNEYCSYCSNFKPTYKQEDVSVGGLDKVPRIATEITCANEEVCKMLKVRFQEYRNM